MEGAPLPGLPVRSQNIFDPVAADSEKKVVRNDGKGSAPHIPPAELFWRQIGAYGPDGHAAGAEVHQSVLPRGRLHPRHELPHSLPAGHLRRQR